MHFRPLTPLIGATSIPPEATLPTAMRDRSTQGLDDSRIRDLLLIGLTVSAGAVDAVSWLGLGQVFSAFMSGNFVFLGLRIAGADGPSMPAVISALAAFGVGAFLAARIVRSTSDSGAVWPRRVTVALGTTLVAEAAFVALWIGVDAAPSQGSTDVLLAVMSLAMGVQTAAVYSLGLRGVTTTAATATWAAVIGDLSRWSQPSDERFRLAGVLIGIPAGVIAGGLLMVHASDWAPILPLAVSTAVIAVAIRRLHPAAADHRGAPSRDALRARRGDAIR